MANSVIRLILSDIASSAALGVNLTNAEIVAKLEAGASQLSGKGSIALGGVCTDQSGNIYVSDFDRHTILKVREGGEVSVLAGEDGVFGNNGTLTNVSAGARFNAPRGLACDKSGNIFVADSGNNQIRMINEGGRVSHIAGAGDGASGFVDGDGATARFNAPLDVAVDNTGRIWVADTGNHSIRRVTEGEVYTFSGDSSGDLENVSSGAQTAGSNDIYNSPAGLAVDANGDIFVCDTGNDKIKLLRPDGWVYLFSGDGLGGKSKGTTAFDGKFNNLRQCDVDRSGNLYVVDKNSGSGSRIIKFEKTGVQQIINDLAGTTSNDEIEGVAVSPAGKLFVIVSDVDEGESSSSSSEEYSESSESSSEDYSESSSSSN